MMSFFQSTLSSQSPTEGGCLGVGYNFFAPSVSSWCREAGAEPCMELCAGMVRAGRWQGSALWAQPGFEKPLLEQNEKCTDIIGSGGERLPDFRMAKRLMSGICTQNEHRLSASLKQDVSAWGEVGRGASLLFSFLCCCLSCIMATTQGQLKKPYSGGLNAKTVLQNVYFNAFFFFL